MIISHNPMHTVIDPAIDTVALYQSSLHSLPLYSRGKVRDSYLIDADKLLMITSDRLSAFDVVLEQPIPGKGQILCQMANFWFTKLAHIVANHLTNIPPETVVDPHEIHQVKGRAIVVKRFQPILIEAVVRGYLAGNGWQEYQVQGSISGIALPQGLKHAQKLSEPIFTPAIKALQGKHDENISFDEMVHNIGTTLANQIRDISLILYREAADYALTHGIIIADTKFEFGLDTHGALYLIDEIFTPDSSRFWAIESYRVGENPPSFDKQFVRDWLNTQPWNKTAPAPSLPAEIIAKTAEKYYEALYRLTNNSSK